MILDLRNLNDSDLSRLSSFYGLTPTGNRRDELRNLALALGIRIDL